MSRMDFGMYSMCTAFATSLLFLLPRFRYLARTIMYTNHIRITMECIIDPRYTQHA